MDNIFKENDGFFSLFIEVLCEKKMISLKVASLQSGPPFAGFLVKAHVSQLEEPLVHLE